MTKRFIVSLLLAGIGCASAKPKAVRAPVQIVAPAQPAPALVEKVSEADLLRYRAAYLSFQAAEAEILEKYKIRASSGESFDPETAVITRNRRKEKK